MDEDAASLRETSSRAVLITGASSGLGRACARTLDRLGMTVYAGVRRAEDADALRTDASPRLTSILLDVTRPDAIAAARDAMAPSLGQRGLFALINNAGSCLAGPLETTPPEALLAQFNVNAVGAIAVTQAFLPYLRQYPGKGRVLLMSSISGRMASPFVGPYAASKFALEAFGDALRAELKPQGIAVSVLEPGPFRTPIWGKAMTQAQALFLQAPPEIRAPYEAMFFKLGARAAQSGEGGEDPEALARRVAHILQTHRPRPRYGVGRGAWRYAALRLLPDEWRDFLLLKALS